MEAVFESPQKNWKLPQNTNMFSQPMSDFYTLIMGLLVHSWFEIKEFSQFYHFCFLALENDWVVKMVKFQ